METKIEGAITQHKTTGDENIGEKIALIEYQEIVNITGPYHDYAEKRLQFYLSILSAGFGLLILFQQQNLTQYQTPYTFATVLVLTLVIGLLSYASLVTWDSLLVDRLRTREKLRSALLATDSDLKRALDLPATMPDQNPLEYEAWSSFAALVRRAGLFGGAKTLIGLGNSIEVGILAMIFISPQLFAGPLSAPILIGGITGFLASLALHVGYARLRYYFAQPKA